MTAANGFNERVHDCPIEGWNLVEASAGTGKTYQIQTLYARLILEKGWTVDQLLVVTFTEAATQELRDRLQAILSKTAAVLAGTSLPDEDSDSQRIGELIRRAEIKLVGEGATSEEKESARARCRLRAESACSEFDRAAIFTTHGFCGRMLSECAFEYALSFDSELVGDKGPLLEEVVRDVYRSETLPLDAERTDLLGEVSIADLLGLVREASSKPGAEIRPHLADVQPDLAMAKKGIQDIALRLRSEVSSWLAEAVEVGIIPTEAGERLRNRLEALATGSVTVTLASAFTAAECKKETVSAAPLTDAMRSFGDACATLVARHAELVGTKLTPKAKWSPVLDDDPEALAALESLLEQFEHQSGALAYLLNKAKGAMLFKAPVCKVSEALEMALRGGLESLKSAPGVLACFTTERLLAGHRAKPDWKRTSNVQPLFEACETFVNDTAKQWRLAFLLRIIDVADSRLAALKTSRNIMTYDDLLLRLKQALTEDGTTQNLLKQAVANRYRLAIVDEFQDTDPIQYEIFRQAFHSQGLPVFVVGDPKQAIYGFRSGDVQTYFSARELAAENARFTLLKNWRSEANMVAAVNALFFSEAEEGPLPAGGVRRAFAVKDICFSPALAAKREAGVNAPMAIEVLSAEKPLSKDQGRAVSAALASRRIAELLQSEAVRASDVAVLVQTHNEARLVKKELAPYGIAAVLQSTGRVFDSDEAGYFLLVVQAMLEPGNPSAVRSALATPIFNAEAQDLNVLSGDGAGVGLQRAAALFRDAHNQWCNHSFIVGFNRLMNGMAVCEGLLDCRDGERRYVNLMQLAEILDRCARERQLGLRASLTWFERQLSGDGQDDEFEIRLDSDADAVVVMTIFKSKGLQFPYVFVPFAWTKQPVVSRHARFLAYHDQGVNKPLILNLDVKNERGLEFVDAANNPKNLHQDELFAEQLRLLYVAVTRAEKRAHLICGQMGQDQRNALHYLLSHADAPARPIAEGLPKKHEVESLLETLESPQISLTSFQREDAVFVSHAVAGAPAKGRGERERPQARKMSGVVDKTWQILSFSKLASHASGPQSHALDAARDYDDGQAQAEYDRQAERELLARNPGSLFSFKPGKNTGNCWHEIFEHLDFRDSSGRREWIADCATRFGLVREREIDDPIGDRRYDRQVDVLERMVESVLTLQLPGAPPLAHLSQTDRLAEMKFDFSTAKAGVSRSVVAEALMSSDWPRKDDFSVVLEEWVRDTTPLAHGFITGFIDLLFRDGINGRYYVLDWKSNKIDGTHSSFNQSDITLEMGKNRYFFQYLLYCVALHQYLSATVNGYEYEANFGGAAYVFLRGTLPPEGVVDWDLAEHSVFFDRPSLNVLERLSEALGCFSRGGS